MARPTEHLRSAGRGAPSSETLWMGLVVRGSVGHRCGGVTCAVHSLWRHEFNNLCGLFVVDLLLNNPLEQTPVFDPLERQIRIVTACYSMLQHVTSILFEFYKLQLFWHQSVFFFFSWLVTSVVVGTVATAEAKLELAEKAKDAMELREREACPGGTAAVLGGVFLWMGWVPRLFRLVVCVGLSVGLSVGFVVD